MPELDTKIKIVDFNDLDSKLACKHLAAINKEWLLEFGFPLTKFDQKIFDDPQTMILDKGSLGGKIIFAFIETSPEPIACGAVIDNSDYEPNSCEIAKMGIYKEFREGEKKTRGIGRQIFQALIEIAKNLKYRKVFILSHTRLEIANLMYSKHPAFKEVKLTAAELEKYTPIGESESRANIKYEAFIEDL